MKRVNDEFEPLTVVNKSDEDIVVLSKADGTVFKSRSLKTRNFLTGLGNNQVRAGVLRSMLLRSERVLMLQKMPGRIIATGKLRIRRR